MKLFKKILYYVVFALLLGIFSFALYKVVTGLLAYDKADEVYDNLQNMYVDTSPVTETEGVTLDEGSEVPDTEPVETAPITVDFETLRAAHPDVVGWLYCPDTPMNYPVAQSGDNDYYLRRDLNGNYLVTGTIFADFRCLGPGEDRNYMIFGHNMDNGTIFGMLKNYDDEEYYKEHPSIWYLTPEGDYRIDVYAALTVSTDEQIYAVGTEDESFNAYLASLAERSAFDAGMELSEEDTFVTLSTCSYAFKNARFILVGRVTPLG